MYLIGLLVNEDLLMCYFNCIVFSFFLESCISELCVSLVLFRLRVYFDFNDDRIDVLESIHLHQIIFIHSVQVNAENPSWKLLAQSLRKHKAQRLRVLLGVNIEKLGVEVVLLVHDFLCMDVDINRALLLSIEAESQVQLPLLPLHH